MATVKFCKPFYDGLGNLLKGATVTLRDESGDVIYFTCTEDTDSGYSGCYGADIDVTRNYYIFVKQLGETNAVCIGNWSPIFIPSQDLENT